MKLLSAYKRTAQIINFTIFLICFAPFNLSAITDIEIDKLIDQMTIEEKVGQLMIVGFEGKKVNKTIRTHIDQRFVGGVALFGRNIQSPQQVARLTNELQRLAGETKHQIPLLIGIDQEGGAVTRLKKGATILPGNMALGAIGSSELAERAGEITAIELAAVGVNLNFAPVMDVNNNPNNPVINRRSFGESPELVSRLGTAYIRGLQRHGVLATAKHFPGHGDTIVDSHTDLSIMKHNVKRIHAIELKPFRAAIDAGVAAIMTAHILYTSLDANLPATLSPAILTGLLRQELRFDGLIITDDMEMKAITDCYRAGEAAVMAIEAGADIILALWESAEQLEIYNALLKAVKRGRISTIRLNQSVRRILKSKQACGAFDRSFSNSSTVAKIVGSQSHKQIAHKIASQAITIVQNDNGIVPLKMKKEMAVLIISQSRTLFNLLHRRHSNSKAVRLSSKPDIKGILPQLTSQANHADVIIVGIVNHQQAELVHQLRAATQTPIIVIAFGSPYPLRRCPDVDASLAAYDGHYASVLAAVEVILGKTKAQGKLPIHLKTDE
ncbi:beta-N-acetylhexosaminidase [Candidatus Poribacteria bacterium]|nr:beta-N-acetylhexosaminidase [Candidatus Poribacteria bacterium]